ncbi:YiiX/YebB-like N1pC/P60 family cysteine hydrolase [Hydrogenophaga sp. NFH-34]|uniref:YiiX/YebB-like N1pC/P60 family cysteine hydrolase n=1 Tax=Hydrogenophaga sp. NFH-34 TaxID=2744446 RepID=UPI001F28315E|nr:YiiX/YebB-like N1pC/P60 family cysteine hydrolase [Hydrogenophaga sp. NFH-34]
MENHLEVRAATTSLVISLFASTCAHAGDQLPTGAKIGDLIFREGTEVVSAAVLAVDRGTFSHVGMLVRDAGQWKVVHATPSEVAGRPDSVVLDDLRFYLDPARSRRHAVFQVQATELQRESAVSFALKQVGRPFSMMASEDGTYCTTLIWQAWRDAGKNLEVTFTRLNIPLMQGDYLLPGVLAKSRHLRKLDEPAQSIASGQR